MVRAIAVVMLLSGVSMIEPVSAQQIRSASGPAPAPPSRGHHQHTPVLRIDLQCGQLTFRPDLHAYCVTLERDLVQGEAKRRGSPVPSARVHALPAQGSEQARAMGIACIGETAMRRLVNGWEQLRNGDGHWIRCKPKVP